MLAFVFTRNRYSKVLRFQSLNSVSQPDSFNHLFDEHRSNSQNATTSYRATEALYWLERRPIW